MGLILESRLVAREISRASHPPERGSSTIERDVLLASLSRVVVVVVVASDARGDRVEIEAQFRRVGRASRVGLGRPPRWTNDDWWLRRMGRQTRGEDARARDEYETRGRKNYFHAGAFAAASRRVTGVRSVDASPVERSRDSTDRESSTSPTRDASGMDGRARGRSFATTRARDDARRRDARRDAR